MTPVAYARVHRGRFVDELCRFMRFASVSAQKSHAADSRACAHWLARHLRIIGLDEVRVAATPGNPIVCARWHRLPHAPTALLYGHYDVQPPEPFEEWTSPPFEPQVRAERLYGRGASDDKGQLFAHVKAIESWLHTRRALPVNVTCLFEGEEEVGSPNLPAFVTRNAASLAADVAVVSDSEIAGPDGPAITESMRGALSLEILVDGPGTDLHSGTFGGAVPNPLQALCEILARLHHRDGRIAIPGFYDRVREPSADERAYMAASGPTASQIRARANTRCEWGEPGYTPYERITVRPALSINGVAGGYRGPGAKAVIPAHAVAKLNFRLVPEQNPAEIAAIFRCFVARVAPPAVRVETRISFQAHPIAIGRNDPGVRAAATAYERGFGRRPVFLRSGGTVPVLHLLRRLLRVPTVMMGFALPDAALHAPNENLHLPTFGRAIRTLIHFLPELARSARR